jgi:rSAM/selenodomain-associated transferase 2
VRSTPLSIVIPALNEAAYIAANLAPLHPLRARGIEIIVADGGSRDDTVILATSHADRVIRAPCGRAAQMNAGAAVARGQLLLFLHADCMLPKDAAALIIDGLTGSGKCWGRFNVRLDGRHPLLSMVAFMMNWRSRISGIATGDQGVFVTHECFDAVGGFSEIPLMEDIDLSRRLKARSTPLCLRATITSSSRRWEQHGVLRTIFLMWYLRFAYWLGASPDKLVKLYASSRS